jgi:AraC-like DNA-binding protein
MNTATSLNTATKALLEVCSRRGIQVDDLLVGAKLDPALFEKYNIRIPADKKRVIWEEAQKRVGDEHIALRAAEIVPFGGYGVLDYLLFASSTLGEALHRTSRFYRLINSNAELRLHSHKKFISAELYNPTITSQQRLGLSAEYSFAMLLLRLRLAYGNEFKPEAVCFTHSAPADASLHGKLFRSPVRFGQAVNRLVFSKALLNASLPQSDAGLAETLDHYAQRLVQGLPAEDSIAGDVREVLRLRLCDGSVSLEATAKALAMSSRNLQRRLNGQGTSYREVLDGLRNELASYYAAQQVGAAEIAHLLGFTETSAFYRALRRWRGTHSQHS